MEYINKIIENKRNTARIYSEYFKNIDTGFVRQPIDSRSNCWLNCIKLKDKEEKYKFLNETNSNGVLTRPVWRMLNKLSMYKNCQTGNIDNSNYFDDRVVNIPSGYRV